METKIRWLCSCGAPARWLTIVDNESRGYPKVSSDDYYKEFYSELEGELVRLSDIPPPPPPPILFIWGCAECTTESSGYDIDLRTMSTTAQLLDWMIHLAEKSWFGARDLRRLAEAALLAMGVSRGSLLRKVEE